MSNLRENMNDNSIWGVKKEQVKKLPVPGWMGTRNLQEFGLLVRQLIGTQGKLFASHPNINAWKIGDKYTLSLLELLSLIYAGLVTCWFGNRGMVAVSRDQVKKIVQGFSAATMEIVPLYVILVKVGKQTCLQLLDGNGRALSCTQIFLELLRLDISVYSKGMQFFLNCTVPITVVDPKEAEHLYDKLNDRKRHSTLQDLTYYRYVYGAILWRLLGRVNDTLSLVNIGLDELQQFICSHAHVIANCVYTVSLHEIIGKSETIKEQNGCIINRWHTFTSRYQKTYLNYRRTLALGSDICILNEAEETGFVKALIRLWKIQLRLPYKMSSSLVGLLLADQVCNYGRGLLLRVSEKTLADAIAAKLPPKLNLLTRTREKDMALAAESLAKLEDFCAGKATEAPPVTAESAPTEATGSSTSGTLQINNYGCENVNVQIGDNCIQGV